MLDRRRRAALAITVVVAILTAGVAIAAGGDDPEVKGVRTSRPAQLVATTPGVRIRPILSVGDVVGGRLGGYQMTGIPDGLGAYRTSDNGEPVDDCVDQYRTMTCQGGRAIVSNGEGFLAHASPRSSSR